MCYISYIYASNNVRKDPTSNLFVVVDISSLFIT